MTKFLVTLAILFSFGFAFAEGPTVLRCKEPLEDAAINYQVSFVKFLNGNLELYEYDQSGEAKLVKSFASDSKCLIEGKIENLAK